MSERFKRLLELAMRGKSLGRDGAREAMEHLVSGQVDGLQIAGFLGAMGPQRIGAAELAGFAEGLRAKAVMVSVSRRPVIDTCGTGGDGLGTFNLSTAAAFVVAGAGVAVAKHGNRAVSSRSGSADVLEALGVAVEGTAEFVRGCIEEHGFGFFFAPRFHPALGPIAPIRKALGVRTLFNLLGPMSNPAGVKRQVVGIFDGSLVEKYAEALLLLGAERVMVVHGDDGMDEISLSAPTTICHGEAGRGVWTERFAPEQAGFETAVPGALSGSDAGGNARALEELLGGADGAVSQAVLLNAGAALWVAGSAKDLRDGIEAARESVRSGKARDILSRLRQRSKDAAV